MGLRRMLRGERPLREAARLAEHERRAAPHVTRLLHGPQMLAPATAREAVSALEPDEALSVLVAALMASGVWNAHSLAGQLVRRRLPYAASDARLLVELTEAGRDDVWTGRLRARAALAALELRAGEGEDVSDLASRLLDVIAGPHHYEAAEWTKLGPRLRLLAPAGGNRRIDLSPLKGDDPWADCVRPIVAADFGDQAALLEALASATASRPTRRWLHAAQPLLTDRGVAMLRALLEAALDVPARRGRSILIEGRLLASSLWLSDMSATVVRGALWAASLVEEDWVVPACERLIARARPAEQLKVTNACFHCLGERADDEAVASLGRFVAELKDRRLLKPAQAALERAAEKRGVTGDQLRERLVPTFGLDADGRGARAVGPAEVAVEVVPPASVTLRYRLAGRDTTTAPASLKEGHEAELGALKSEAADIRRELAIQRRRLEELLADDRAWEYGEWRRWYLDHPLLQVLTRHLIWRLDGQAVLPAERGRFLTLDSAIVPPEDGEVRLWHPLEAPTDEIVAWRALLGEHRIRQPFKQAHREIYLLAPAERGTDVYSNRFAAHIVRYPQVYALAKERGWGIRALGPYDNGGGEQWRDFPGHGLRASFWMEPADAAAAGPIAGLASTDQVRFTRLGRQETVPLADVPPRAFSEAMRDVDLFVGVASIAADANWIDGGAERFHAYWHEHAFGELTESAKVRREALADILPGLRIAGRLELGDRYLRVRGNLHTYRIHLGSANILMEPDGRYLCIVPGRTASTGKLFLPFDDDRLSVILSKAVLLAADDRIDDPTILRQLR